jgi:Holliday junction resolvasome RuvABC endonuclease subunit
LGYLGHLIRAELDEMRVPWLEIAPTALKKFATGSGAAKKDAMKAAAVEHLALDSDASDDEADALWLRELGLQLLGQGSTADRWIPKVQLPKELLQ